MNFFQDSQSDLEVILEFLEEYHRQSNAENVDKVHWNAGVPIEERSVPVDETHKQHWAYCEPPPFLSQDVAAGLSQNTTATQSTFATTRKSTKHPSAAVGSGKRVRLFHFLFEMLENPNMAHCLSWVPAAAGVFRFSSRNKDQVAALWGQRKGNKRPMTYQKMSRALRNYARSGEIFKVKKKLTYQFSRDTLMLLQKCHRRDL
ncbi:transcription factor Spi-B [Archocentrus centrarchus]|uniref:transcription factor Spi-B n=1 Tax=Archocentrus centrarchus TaxID=63155 RepID=UPI0011E9C8DE|nr:transcription factor Spi-B-like [Archocentrus centrarchus]